jgi:hypothetical protein
MVGNLPLNANNMARRGAFYSTGFGESFAIIVLEKTANAGPKWAGRREEWFLEGI